MKEEIKKALKEMLKSGEIKIYVSVEPDSSNYNSVQTRVWVDKELVYEEDCTFNPSEEI